MKVGRMMATINIEYMSDEAVDTLRSNIDTVVKKLNENPDSPQWLRSYIPGEIYVTKKYEIEDFELAAPDGSKDRETDFNNSVLLYERLKDLPQYVLSDERFWMWVNFEKGYKAALAYMPVKKESTFKDHWLHSQSNHRSLMFGVLSRTFYRVANSVDESLEDKYEYTRFVIDNPLRYREYSWRTYSNEKKLILAALKAEKRALEMHDGPENNSLYRKLASEVSKKASCMLLDVMSEKDIEEFIFKAHCRLIEESALHEGK